MLFKLSLLFIIISIVHIFGRFRLAGVGGPGAEGLLFQKFPSAALTTPRGKRGCDGGQKCRWHSDKNLVGGWVPVGGDLVKFG